MSLKSISKTHIGNNQKYPKDMIKVLCSDRMQDMKKSFGRWDATHLFHDASINSFVKDAFFAMPMYHDMGKMWRLTLHTLYYICCM